LLFVLLRLGQGRLCRVGCLALGVLLLLLLAGAGLYGFRDRIKTLISGQNGVTITDTAAVIPLAGTPAVTGNPFDGYPGVWVVKDAAANPSAADLVTFRLENNRLIGAGGASGEQNRMELAPAAAGKLSGTMTRAGATLPVEAMLSADRTILTLTLNPGTGSVMTATLVRRPAPTVIPAPPAAAPRPDRAVAPAASLTST